MQDYLKKIEGMKAKAQQLLNHQHRLEKDNERLKEVNRELTEALQKRNEKTQELEEKLKVLKLAKQVSGEEPSEDKEALKKKINEFIKEIDKCVAMLNN